MATVNNIVIPNFAPATGSTYFNQIWKLTRAMKKAGWKYQGSSNASAKDTSTDPALDKWNFTPTTTSSGAAAVVAAPARGRAAVSGLTGITAADKGRFLVISGSSVSANNNAHQIEEILSSTSVSIDARNFAVGADASARSYTIVDYNQDTYSATFAASACWWTARGPSILKVPFTVAVSLGPTGSDFVRGENVVQATTGAEGEFMGYIAGLYMAIQPRKRGTGVGAYGWDTTNVITGGSSGASITQNGTTLEYRNEVVIWKNTNETSGSIFISCIEPTNETTFASLTAAAGCTAAVAPGGGGTSNTFPTFAWLMFGTSTAGAGSNWVMSSTNPAGNAQIICIDCIEEVGYTADGSWCEWVAQTGQGSSIGYAGIAFQRVEESEPGDLNPYVTLFPMAFSTIYANARTTMGAFPGTSKNNSCLSILAGSANFAYRGWRGRGSPGDSASNSQDMEPAALLGYNTNNSFTAAATTSIMIQPSNPTLTKALMPVYACSLQTGQKCLKGRFKWISTVDGGNQNTTYNGKKQMQLSPATGALVMDGWDGVTNPVSQNS